MLIAHSPKYWKASCVIFALAATAGWVSHLEHRAKAESLALNPVAVRPESRVDPQQVGVKAKTTAVSSDAASEEKESIDDKDQDQALAIYQEWAAGVDRNGERFSELNKYMMLRNVIYYLGGYDNQGRLRNIHKLNLVISTMAVPPQEIWRNKFTTQAIMALQEIRKDKLEDLKTRKSADIKDDLLQVDRIVKNLMMANSGLTQNEILNRGHLSAEFLAQVRNEAGFDRAATAALLPVPTID